MAISKAVDSETMHSISKVLPGIGVTIPNNSPQNISSKLNPISTLQYATQFLFLMPNRQTWLGKARLAQNMVTHHNLKKHKAWKGKKG
jgi:hypothetical protein